MQAADVLRMARPSPNSPYIAEELKFVRRRTGVTINPGTYFGSTAGSPAFLIQNSTVTFNPGTYHITSATAGTPGIQMSSHTFGGSTTVSFGSGTYTVYGGITDNDLFGSAVNWNSTSGSPSLFIIDGGGLQLTGNSGSSGSAGTSTGGVTFYNTGTAPRPVL